MICLWFAERLSRFFSFRILIRSNLFWEVFLVLGLQPDTFSSKFWCNVQSQQQQRLAANIKQWSYAAALIRDIIFDWQAQSCEFGSSWCPLNDTRSTSTYSRVNLWQFPKNGINLLTISGDHECK